MVEPYAQTLLALPKAWTKGTKGRKRGEVVKVKLDSDKDFEKHEGKLKGKILLLDDARDHEPRDESTFQRYSEDDLHEMESYEIRDGRRGAWRERMLKRWKTREKRAEFLREEGVLATISVSSWTDGVIRIGSGGSYEAGKEAAVTSLTMGIEHYNRLVRLLDDDVKVELELEVKAKFHRDDTQAYNTIAEIPGSDPDAGIVMLGAHLDSWHAGTGATDAAAGCAVAMEAVRILQALEAKPKRTIRIALWGGEEQGLHGSKQHVRNHFAERAPGEVKEEEKDLPEWMRERTGELSFRDDYERFSVYFNLDNGGGKIRGIYAQENMQAQPIFEAWLGPLADLGADTVTQRTTGSTDHASFDRVGLPGFQFIQDRLEYFTRTHHSNMDLYDYLEEKDLKQASVVMAVFAYHAAQREERFPRKPLPPDPPKEKDEAKEKDEQE
jgi:hypothetical protein